MLEALDVLLVSGSVCKRRTCTLRHSLGDELKSSWTFCLQAYRSWVTKNGDEKRLPAVNLTNDQLFFVGFAQVRPSDSGELEWRSLLFRHSSVKRSNATLTAGTPVRFCRCGAPCERQRALTRAW